MAEYTFSVGLSEQPVMTKKIALVTGATGQDGSYLCELLLLKGYEVHALMRRTSTPSTKNIEHILDKLIIHHGDLCNEHNICNLLYELQPNEVYNLAAQSHVAVSFEIPEYTADVVALGPLRILEGIRRYSPYTKFYQASTSEMFGSAPPPQDEYTIKQPNNPYGIAKLYAHELVRLYRQSYGIFASCGILFNHESPRRGDTFVTQKIVKGLINCREGKQKKLLLGNLDAKRDWGYAGDYVEAMWMMLQRDDADDYVIGTGIAHTVKDFLETAASYIKIEWTKYVDISSDFYRPLETSYLLANQKKANEKLGWKPKVSFEELVKMMVESEEKKINTK